MPLYQGGVIAAQSRSQKRVEAKMTMMMSLIGSSSSCPPSNLWCLRSIMAACY